MVVNEDVNPWVDLIIPLFLCPTSEAPLSVAALRLGTLATGAVHLASWVWQSVLVFFSFLLTTELRLEEKGGAPNTNGHTRNLGFKNKSRHMTNNERLGQDSHITSRRTRCSTRHTLSAVGLIYIPSFGLPNKARSQPPLRWIEARAKRKTSLQNWFAPRS